MIHWPKTVKGCQSGMDVAIGLTGKFKESPHAGVNFRASVLKCVSSEIPDRVGEELHPDGNRWRSCATAWLHGMGSDSDAPEGWRMPARIAGQIFLRQPLRLWQRILHGGWEDQGESVLADGFRVEVRFGFDGHGMGRHDRKSIRFQVASRQGFTIPVSRLRKQ